MYSSITSSLGKDNDAAAPSKDGWQQQRNNLEDAVSSSEKATAAYDEPNEDINYLLLKLIYSSHQSPTNSVLHLCLLSLSLSSS